MTKSVFLSLIITCIYNSSFSQNPHWEKHLLKLYESQYYDKVVAGVDSLLPLVDNKARLYQIKADALYFLNDVDRSLSNYLLTLDHLKTGDLDTTRLIEAYSHTGFCYVYLGQYLEALPYYEKAFEITKAAKDSVEMSNQLSHIGRIYANLNQYGDAEIFLRKAYNINFALNDSIALSYDLADLAALNFALGEYRSAIKQYRESLKVTATRAKNHNAILLRKGKMAEAYFGYGRLDSADYFINQSIKKAEELKDSLSLAKQLLVKSKILTQKKDYDSAMHFINQAERVFNQENAGRYIVDTKMIKSTIYLGKGDYQRALEILQKLIPSLYELNDMENMVAAYKRIGLIYEKKGEFILALENFKKQQIFQDSLAGKNKQLSILTLEKRFETSEKEKQIFSLEAQNKLQEAEAKAQKRDKVILLITALMLLVILTFIFYRYKVNKKNENLLRDRNRALDELNNAKNKLFAVISHDLRNPVSAFRNMTEALDENFNSLPKEKTAKYLKKMRYNAVHVESQLNDLLAWASNEIGKDKLMTREVAVKELVKQVFDLLRPIAEDGGVEMDYFIDDDIRINTHPELFKTVVRNIVANAIKFTQEGGQVLLSAKYKNGAPQLLITDTGIGMEEDEIKILFSDEGKLKANEKSQMGMGLSITKDIMKRLDGEIKVTSIKGKGTSFTLKFAA